MKRLAVLRGVFLIIFAQFLSGNQFLLIFSREYVILKMMLHNNFGGGLSLNITDDLYKTLHGTNRSKSKLAEASKRLSSGNRINSAADDAAGLAISEKLRAIDRGLRQGLRNTSDGINYLDTVEGCTQEMSDMLHRLKELAVEAANGTEVRLDREALDLEYQQILEEYANIADTSHFNGIPLIERHMPEYEKDEGNVIHDEPIEITGENSVLTIGYTLNGNNKECTVTIPEGTYTAGEVADVVDTLLYDKVPELIIGLNKDSQFTMQCEGGKINYISGSASSLFYDTVLGSTDGYLLGVTRFSNDTTAKLEVIAGKNDVIEFRLGNKDETKYSLKLDVGKYNRPELVAQINEKIAAAGLPCEVEAVMYTTDEGDKVIGLRSETTITGLSGNFLMIDEGKAIHSPIYDICCYSTLVNSEATLTGTKSIVSGVEIERGRNDYFVLDASWYADGLPHSEKLKINLLDDDENIKQYSAKELVARIQQELDDAGAKVVAELSDSGTIKMYTLQYGKECKVKLDTSDVPSGYMVYDLFDKGTLQVLSPSRQYSSYTGAMLKGGQQLGTNIVISSLHNKLSYNINFDASSGIANQTIEFDIPAGTYNTSTLTSKLNSMLADQYPSLSDKLVFSADNRLILSANGIAGSEITNITANKTSAYSKLLQGSTLTDNCTIVAGKENDATSYETTVPGTGRSNVTSVSGKTTDAVSYSSYTPSTNTSQSTYNYVNYSYSTPTLKDGDTIPVDDDEQGNVVDDSTATRTPATVTYKNALTQFTAAGTSLKDISVSFNLTDKDGKSTTYNAVIAKGSTAAQAIEQLNDQLGSAVTASAVGNDIVLTSVEKGKGVSFDVRAADLQYSAARTNYETRDGAVVDRDNNKVYVPAKLTLQNAGTNIPLTLDADTDRLQFTAGGKTYDLRLTQKTYSSLDELASEINSKISESDSGNPQVSVTASGGSLTFIGNPQKTGNISIGSATTCHINQKKTTNNITSSPYYDPATNTEKTPATIRAEGADTHFPLAVDSTNNTITMSYSSPDASNPSVTRTETLTITVPDGTYSTAQDYTDAVNQAIAAAPALNGKITASYSPSGSNKGLTFTTVGSGNGYNLSNLGGTSKVETYKKQNATTGGTVDPSTNKVKYPATAENNAFGSLFDNDGIEINDYNDNVSININGVNYNFKLTHGEYKGSTGKSSIASQVESGLSSAGVTVSVSGNSLKIVTDLEGNSATISLGGDNTSPVFKRAVSSDTIYSRYRSYNMCSIIGTRNIGTMEIKDYYNKMQFTLSHGGIEQQVEIEIPEGTYTAATLAAAIQNEIDSKAAPGILTVGVSGDRITISGAAISNSCGIYDFSGKLFNRVFQSANYYSVSRHSEVVGTTTGSEASYIIGRNNMEPETEEEIESGKNVLIYTGLNDELIFDFTYQGETHKIDIKIPAGGYTPEEIAAAVETAGRAAMKGLKDPDGNTINEEYFHASIGLAAVGIEENLNVAIKSPGMLVLSYILPDNGTIERADTIIDGIRGNAAYRIFYSATDSPKPSRVIGKADLSNGIVIQSGQNDTLSLSLDEEHSSITIPPGKYTDDDLVSVMNRLYEEQDSLVRVSNMNGHLMFYTTENGAYHFGKFTGNAADDLFYEAETRDEDTEIGIQYGRRTNSYIWYNKTRADAHLMRINTTGITTIERALKAIDRINAANAYLQLRRAESGAMKNRSEHTFSRNQNYIENLENADSSLRDSDMPSEIMNAEKAKVLLQVQNYMIGVEKENAQKNIILDSMA